MGGPRLGDQYSKLWSASSISNLGDGVSLAAVPLLAAALTRYPVVFAVVTVESRFPWPAFWLMAGGVADAVDRKKLVAFVDGGRFVVSALLGLGVLQGWVTIWHLYGAAFLLGTGRSSPTSRVRS